MILWFNEGCSSASTPVPAEITVAAASDLTPAFNEIRRHLEKQNRLKVVYSFGSSGLLAKQIEQGAPFDVYSAASESYVDRLQDQGLIVSGSKQVFARGALVIWQREDAAVKIDSLKQLAMPEVRRVAIANPDHAPYGIAAREALQRSGLWASIQPKIVFGENVVQTLQFAQTGNVDAAIVARSLAGSPGGRVVSLDPAGHSPISQVVCILRRTSNLKASQEFVDTLGSPEGRAILERNGFTVR